MPVLAWRNGERGDGGCDLRPCKARGTTLAASTLDAMAEIGSWISAELGRETESRVGRALKAKGES